VLGAHYLGAHAVFPVSPDEPDDGGDQDELYSQVEAVEDLLESWIGVPLVPELHADVGEGKAPGPGADEGVKVKAELGHAGDASREGDKGPNDGKQATDDYGSAAVLRKEVFGAIEVVTAEEEEAAEALDGRTPAPATDPVRRDGAEVAADGTGGGDPEKLGGIRAENEAGKGHDDLGGQWDAGRFDAHEESDSCQTSGRDDGNDEGCDGGKDVLGHWG